MTRHAVLAVALVLAATACGGDADREVAQEGEGGYRWKATDEICNVLPYGELADPLGAREEAADRNKRAGQGAPGVQCVQPLVETGPAKYGNVKVELDLAYTESVDFAKDVFARSRENTRKGVPAGGFTEVPGVGKEAYRFGFNKSDDRRQVRELRLRDSNLMIDITVTADARTLPTPESLGAFDASVADFAKASLKALRG
ncbi:hypothetical protein [Streptomyces subrutilus]|uniref:DUF3558 domain-containing protein n=1 Tax=Streptomyces subrutilus TaxID=36818 RepID=A0A1E5PW78_9ACTN|nr:hypothetical protein [Streptomyces subrutilus]OEJ33827.1 hypothetical protein BGK67_23025 [Streptomyces subrutilus]